MEDHGDTEVEKSVADKMEDLAAYNEIKDKVEPYNLMHMEEWYLLTGLSSMLITNIIENRFLWSPASRNIPWFRSSSEIDISII
ncbi:hypothetical protein BDV32DRAFT_121501 [Aspergillus pseudonomiae]|nr:hypothetical protein BDV32DRAFT_121501 [Aspergillus pseudonomiae]